MVDPKKASELANVYTASDLVDADIRFGVDDAVNELSAQLSLAELKKTANVVTAANVAALYALTYAIDNQLYQTLGYTTEGIGANLYRYDSGSSATPDYGFILDGIGGDGSGTGTGRFIAVDQTRILVTQWGAIGDGQVSGSTHTGTDNTAEIQACIDWCIANDRHLDIVFPESSGSYLVSDTLLIGALDGADWDIVDGCTFRGASVTAPFPATGYNYGPVIQATFTDRPVIAIQSARRVVIEDLTIYGLSNFATRIGSEWIAGDSQDLTLKSTSFVDGTNVARGNRYSPSAAIAVDPYGSLTPSGDRYPNTSTSRYVGNAASSGFAIRRCVLGHARVGLLLGAGVTAMTSEFDCHEVFIRETYHAIATCHQDVKAGVFSNCRFQYCYAVLTGAIYGNGNGNCGFSFRDCTGGAIGRFVDHLNMEMANALEFDGGLWEVVGCVGNTMMGYSSIRQPVVFRNTSVGWAMETADISPAFDGTSTFTLVDHGFVDNEEVHILPGTGPDFYKSVRFYIANATADTFQLRYTPGMPPARSGASAVIDFATSSISAGTLEVYRPHVSSGYQIFEQCQLHTNRAGSGRTLSISPQGAGFDQLSAFASGSQTQVGHRIKFSHCYFNIHSATTLAGHLSFATWDTETTSRWVEFSDCFYYTSSGQTRLNQVGWDAMAFYRMLEASTAGSGSPNVLLPYEHGKLLTNEGVTAKNYNSLPTAATGLTYTFVVQDADGMRITAATGDTIRLGNKVTATAGYIESTTIGDYVTLTAINATEWLGLAYGTWTDGTFTYTLATTT